MVATISPDILADSNLHGLVSAIEPILRAEIDLPHATYQWRSHRDKRDRVMLDLSIMDTSNAEAHASFAPIELESENVAHLKERLHELKGAAVRVGAWRTSVDLLFQQLKDWIISFRQKQWVVLEEVVEVIERLSGKYEISALKLIYGNETVWIKPIAIWIVGAQGRVDVLGDISRFTLVYEGGPWFVVNDDITKKLVPLTERVFHKILSAY